jgi:ArsR family transcriptional regulator, zinc-responsive transcriptional repressor
MGVTKTDVHQNIDLEIAAWARILSNPARVAILRYLLESKSCINGDLSQQIGLAQPTISQHLKELKSTGLIQGKISGTSINYCIDGEKWEDCRKIFNQFFVQEIPPSSCCSSKNQ